MRALKNKAKGIGAFYLAGTDKIPPRLKIRQSLRGGKTELFALIAEVCHADPFEICYYDFNSLYPAMALKISIPIGPGSYIVGEDACRKLKLGPDACYFCEDVNWIEVDGVALATVFLPPSNSLKNLPFLPFRHESKTYAIECKECLLQQNKDLCNHGKDQRSFTQAYQICELVYAKNVS